MESLGVMGWGLAAAENSSAVAAVVAAVVVVAASGCAASGGANIGGVLFFFIGVGFGLAATCLGLLILFDSPDQINLFEAVVPAHAKLV